MGWKGFLIASIMYITITPQKLGANFNQSSMWKDVTYEPGEVKAVVYKDGAVIGEKTIKTAGEVSMIKLSPDRTTIMANGIDLSYILVEAFDKDGNPAPLADNALQIEVNGTGYLAGVGNGNPQSLTPFKGNTVNLFYGKAMIIIGSGFKKGLTNVSVRGEGLNEVRTQLEIR
ncbi:MAG TPA: hypothetical protein DIV44_06970 [Leeuwenhoekiella sp.]|nr:hypothetical protein [Leeuwenhoekiella sp.]HBO30147.1 hypothetical protein [Leeuwenhoekiella sp.]HCQ76536.1 hypothetical protein [Leeuwenhoekiella sp.]